MNWVGCKSDSLQFCGTIRDCLFMQQYAVVFLTGFSEWDQDHYSLFLSHFQTLSTRLGAISFLIKVFCRGHWIDIYFFPIPQNWHQSAIKTDPSCSLRDWARPNTIRALQSDGPRKAYRPNQRTERLRLETTGSWDNTPRSVYAMSCKKPSGRGVQRVRKRENTHLRWYVTWVIVKYFLTQL